ncbi:MAG: hypothetical protein IKP02_11540 [Paludibacteraceae bacterium]|nr:hypothetical protein [Paludibacteraceae bacterium]
MRKFLLLFVALCCAGLANATEGALPGGFTINANGDKIQFSKGNLQYNAMLGTHATADGTAQGTWRFAENQWETILQEDNERASSTFNGWIDNFVWGTSGYNDKYPYMTSTDYEDYLGLVTKEEETWGTKYDVTDIIGTNYDWGVYNAISNGGNQANVWRALTQDEIKYLTARNNGTLWGVGVVNGVIGIIFLPDDWSTPQGLTFKCDNSNELSYISPMLFDYQAYFYRTSDNAENINVYDDNDWRYMEVAGAVFMPSVYYTGKDYYHNPYEGGDYWTSQAWGFSYDDDVTLAKGFSLSCSAQGVSRVWFDNEKIFLRRAVRLVQTYDGTGTAQEPELEPKALTGRFSVSDDKQVIFSQGNLRYKASSNEWSFANSQYSMIGYKNENIAANYSGWIDLFGWGTGNNPVETSTESAPYASFSDWTANPIVNGNNETWYTLSAGEWDYLLNTRTDAANLKGQAVVNDIMGYILLPDDWTLPANLTFTPTPNDYTTNIYTLDQWTQMEAAGAVFLPAAGDRLGTDINSIKAGNGYYWTPTPSPEYSDMAQAVTFTAYTPARVSDAPVQMGYAVRPAREADRQGVEEVGYQPSAFSSQKLLRDGVLYIERNGKTYNAQGAEVK